MTYTDQFTAAIHPQFPDIAPLVLTHKLMTRQAAIMLVDIEPTSLIKSQPDCCVLTEAEKVSCMIKRICGNK